ncbi:glycosyltransferase family 39 protein [Arthrobacter sp. ov118]|uniref:glycosyltransferase family 39 protein n=1 Tax=Arthrobacter sp. ov118 TaxID=1761747 RepID=UPI00116070C7|nr:glycosyltransferase family 39 protein [Arthrobacter sp. ov118]
MRSFIAHWWTVALVGLVAFLFRLLPLTKSNALGGFRGYDDGVHYASGVYLISGALPYRDFVLVHPPGISVLMAPFAWIGYMTSDRWGIGLARILFVVIGTSSAMIVASLLRSRGIAASLVGGGLYAVWVAANIAERSIMLSALLNVCLLLAFLFLRKYHSDRRARWLFLAGGMLGLGLSFKLWAVISILVLAIFVVVRFGRRGLLAFLGGTVSLALAVAGPFFLAAPQAMFQDVVLAQMGRSDVRKGIEQRLEFFVGSPVPTVVLWILAALLLIAVLAPWIGAAVARKQYFTNDDAWCWALLVVTQAAALLTSGSFFDHYANFVAPTIALTLGAFVGSLARLAGRVAPRSGPGIVAVLGIAALVPAGIAGFSLNPPPLQGVSETAVAKAVSTYQCVWAPFAYMSVVSDSLSRSVARGCGPLVDYSGVKMMIGSGPKEGSAFDVLRSTDSGEETKLAAAEAAVIGAPHSRFLISKGMDEVLRSKFRLATRSSNLEVWVRR